MIVGFTGTQKGMTVAQLNALEPLLSLASELHHGDCIGADAQVHKLAEGFAIPVVLHPPDDDKKRAYCNGSTTVVLEPKPYLMRNRDIAQAADVLLAAPQQRTEPDHQRAGGTWATIRYARRIGKTVCVIWPDGSKELDGWTVA